MLPAWLLEAFVLHLPVKHLCSEEKKEYFEMREQNVLGRRYFYPLISSFSTYRSLPSATKENLPVATKIANEVICLPLHHELCDEDISRVLNVVIK